MTSASLIRWAGLEERRRRGASRGLLSLPGVLLSIMLGSLLGGEIARRLLLASEANLLQTAIGASHVWVAAGICGFTIGVFAAPFRIYWRHDSKILASLPVPGKSLFALALWRSQRSAALVCLALACALVPLGVLTDMEIAGRHLVLLALGYAGAAWLGPAATLAAGAVVASNKAQAMIASMSGEFQAPRSSWLGIMPGLAATAVALTVMAAAPWAVGARPPGGSIALIAALGLGIPALALLWAWSKADSVIPAAIREVAALDQEILAHVERSTPSLLERGFYKLVLSSAKARLLAYKDTSLSRRRFPSPYFMIPCGTAALWIVAGTQPTGYLPWAGSIYGGLIVYAIVMAHRSWVAPVEIPRLLRTLAIGHSQISRAKGSQVFLRILFIAVLGGIPVVLRAPEMLSAVIWVGLSTLLALVVSLRA